MESQLQSPTAQRKNKVSRQPHLQDSPHHSRDVQSDSSLPATHTPRPKKSRARQNDHTAASGNDAPNPRTAGKPPRAKPTHNTQDSSASLATPAKSFAYASAAFNNSPAASSLPIPKFASRSVPKPAPESTMQARLDQEGASTLQSPSPPSHATPDPLARMRSPLDMFFNADRQEKAKKNSLGSASNDPASPFLPRQTPSAPNRDQLMFELDNPESPAAARSTLPNYTPTMAPASRSALPNHTPTMAPASETHHNDATAAATQSLKNFLRLPQQPTPQQHQSQSTTSSASNNLRNPFVTTTPQQQQSRAPNYDSPFHYGNRNLSPLFQAARSPNGGGPAHGNTDSPLQDRTPINQPQPFDPRAYLNHHAQSASIPANPPFPPLQPQRPANAQYPDPRFFPSGPNGHHAPQSSGVPTLSSPYPNGNSVVQDRAPQPYVEHADVRDMEAKLRGILKLG